MNWDANFEEIYELVIGQQHAYHNVGIGALTGFPIPSQ